MRVGEEGTERAFSGALVKNKKEGIYVCRLCGLPLYGSDAKFESGTGWPSFFKPFDATHVHQERDTKFGSISREQWLAGELAGDDIGLGIPDDRLPR